MQLAEALKHHRHRYHDGRGYKIGVLEAFDYDDAVDLIGPLGVKILPGTMPVKPKKELTEHAYKTCRLIRDIYPKAEIILAQGHHGGCMGLADLSPDVVTASIGGGMITKNAIEKLSKTAFILFAAGNSGEEGEQEIGKYDDLATTVGAVDRNEKLKNYSSRGKGYVDIVAITDLTLSDGTFYNGTSAATPLAACLALRRTIYHCEVLGYKPHRRALRKWIEANCHDIAEEGWDLSTGYGILKLPKTMEVEEIVLIPGTHEVIRRKYREKELVSSEEMISYVESYIEDGRMRVAIRDVEKLALTAHWESRNRTVHIAR